MAKKITKKAKKKTRRLAPHGTLQRYKTCRCAKCRAANAAHQRAYQRKLREMGAGPRKMVVIDEKVHARVAKRSEKEGVSMRTWVNDALKEALKAR